MDGLPYWKSSFGCISPIYYPINAKFGTYNRITLVQIWHGEGCVCKGHSARLHSLRPSAPQFLDRSNTYGDWIIG